MRCLSCPWLPTTKQRLLSRSTISHRRSYHSSWLSAIDFTHEACISHLRSCTNLSELNQIHSQMIKSGLSDAPFSTFLCNNVIRSYVRLGAPRLAFSTFIRMNHVGVSPDNYTFPAILKATTQIFALREGRAIHGVAMKIGLDTDVFVESGLIHLYAKFGEFDDAHQVFDESPHRKLGSWNAIISGFVQGGRSHEALSMFFELGRSGLVPDDVTIVSVVPACASLGDLDLASQIHGCAVKLCLTESEVLTQNALVDMYGKCGRMDLARKMFDEMPQRNVSSWTSMIVGLAVNGLATDALRCFEQMLIAGVRPNHVTFVGVLSACVHAGLVDEGLNYFDEMVHGHKMVPMMQHYGCMVDLLGRAGRLQEAKEMIESMPMKPNVVIWGALLGACEKHTSVDIGEWVARHLLELEPDSDGVYVVLSNIYASANMWEDVQSTRRKMKEGSVAKTPGFSLATNSSY
ncbi:pentatricopeptide repeat-containing protein At1g77170, mitochondrial [Nymphaea colorata]|uniref:Pentacotripeptide-repeat region of PRORP domain-containing protein n=1 Tax=Nymphaea colorata TaxID=210225 RepID=A0A5K0VUZ4_9MAGN|nr:pentatricopeptide repeat-containing protein At1g77170, mitochondrial [Nymphaea colorata]